MIFKGGKKSTNIEDRTSSGGGMTKLAAGGGIGAILIALISFFFTGNLGSLVDVFTSGIQPASYETVNVDSQEYNEQKEFAAVVFAHLEDYWNEAYPASKGKYTEPQLVLFSGSVNSACGTATAQVGPFYCPGDQKVYLDLSFGDELAQRYGAKGDYAMAYVLAHEVGHHIQQQLGITDQLNYVRQRVSEKDYNKYSVQLELQADYFAGAFTKYLSGKTFEGQPILEMGDVEEAIEAAHAIGDDTLQKQAQGYAVPDSFTHGTSAQRMEWFKRGYTYGDLENGNTFKAAGFTNIKY
ncbi:KPN_02809 family neutral zinc metallopeptidase [Vagococcus xieshaowenii]|uniref:Metalloprotease n=1 Tax=Vagococcus xieshaowenii TaxID=2562451 RepID=A0AAJ5EEU0_9ENTE|nr:neutral zinc metallopeptidase [Vagococcus xieshaowenii]QCA28554.1 metalloprotease [Vagococcus xieshaowenii]TFZ40638.1 metalloprotease [Vagococcus xieshaowenii]